MKITLSNKKPTKKDIFVLIPLAVASVCFFTANVMENYHVLLILRLISLGCIILGLFLSKIQINWLVFLFLAGTFISSMYSMELDAIFALGCFAILFNRYSFEYAAKISKYVVIILALVLIIGMCLGIYENVSVDLNGRVRYYLGFNNPNVAGEFSFILLTLIFLSYKKISYVELVGLNIVNCFVFVLTDSRTPFFSFLLMSVIYYVGTYFEKFARICSYIGEFIVFFIVFFSKAIVLIMPQLDIVLSGRLQLYTAAIQDMEIKSFFFGGSPNNMENFYLSFASIHGIVLLIILFVIVMRKVRDFYDSGNIKEAAFVLAFLVYGEFENVLSSFDSVVTMLFWACILGKKGTEYKNDV